MQIWSGKFAPHAEQSVGKKNFSAKKSSNIPVLHLGQYTSMRFSSSKLTDISFSPMLIFGRL